jgi:hypothetical protein
VTETAKWSDSGCWLMVGNYDPGFVAAIDHDLTKLSNLPPGWDGYGAPVIDSTVIAAARAFARAIPENVRVRPLVVPMSNGTLQFEWHRGPRVLEFEFESPRTIRFLQWDPTCGMEEESAFRADDVERVVDLIQWFISDESL